MRLATLALMAALLAASALGCGGEAQVATVVTEAEKAPALTTATNASANDNDMVVTVPTAAMPSGAYPNLDESTVNAVRAAARLAYEQAYGDGSGASEVWGPNIIGDWALMGMENFSGSAGQDVLLHRMENASAGWEVKDMGHGLSEKWRGETPAGLWPQ